MNKKLKISYLSDYKKPDFLIPKAELYFDLRKPETQITTILHIRRQGKHNNHLVLDGVNLKLVNIYLNNKKLLSKEYQLKKDCLILKNVPNQFTLCTTVTIHPDKNTALEGLYISNGIYCTQCEPHGFRRITFFLDRPDVMTQFTTTIAADRKKHPILLSNGNLIARSGLDKFNNRHLAEVELCKKYNVTVDDHFVTWEDPSLKSCYLFALVAGDLDCIRGEFITKTNRNISLEIYTEKGLTTKTKHAMHSLQKSMQWEEERFNLEYDLNTFMLVAINDFNMGAMENKGLNVFNSKCLLVNDQTATDDDYLRVENVVAHEYFHNWTGNRITCRDWFQLALKEGLTTFRDQLFSGTMNSTIVQRIKDVDFMQTWQFAEDAGPNAHPVQPKSYLEINNFYTYTVYHKGAEIVHMLPLLLGMEKFNLGLALFFKRYDQKPATVENFINCMQVSSKINLKQFKKWYDKAGTPLIKISTKYAQKAKTFTVTVKQSDKMHFPLAFGLLSRNGDDILPPGHILNIRNNVHKFTFKNIKELPIPSILRNFSAPVKIDYEHSEADLLFLFAKDTDAVNKWAAGQKLAVKIIIDALNSQKISTLFNDFVKVVRSILQDKALDNTYKSLLIKLPAQSYIMNLTPVVDVEAISMAIDKVTIAFAKSLKQDLSFLYGSLNMHEAYSIDFKAIGRRNLKNLCLYYLAQLQDQETINLCIHQYKKANNMTDAIGSLRALTDINCAERAEVLHDFYQKWQHDELVINKWLELQAISKLPNTLDKVINLSNSPSFKITNPNKVYALFRTFCMQNHRNFHAKDGSSYKFLADQIIKLDALNPHVAADLAIRLTNFRKFAEPYNSLMREQILRISKIPNLSKNTYEIIKKTNKF